jgi:sugar lactone lactonase YvrE
MRFLIKPGRRAGHRAAALVVSCVAALAVACGSGDEGPSAGASGEFRSVSLLAGALNAGGPGYVDGPAVQARFNTPTGVAVAEDGAVWISEESGRIRRMDAAGLVETVVADVGALAIGRDANGRALSLFRPGAMARGPGGSVYVVAEQMVWSDSGPHDPRTALDERWVVLRVNRDGSVVPVLRSSRPRVARTALGLSVERSGQLLVSDAACAVWRGTPGSGVAEAELLHHLAGTAEAPACSGFDGVTSVTTDPQGRVVYSVMHGDVHRLESDGSVTTLAQAAVFGHGCVGMAYDRRGRLLLNRGGWQLSVLDAQGVQPWTGSSLEAGWFDGPAEAARFSRPCGLALDASGEAVFVVDQGMHTLRRIEADGRVTTLAGLARQEAFVDGVGLAARFGWYFNLASGRDGQVLVADGSQGLVRQIDALGHVRTIAGQPGGDRQPPGVDGPLAQATFVHPQHALLAGDGSLWVGDYSGVRRLGTDGVVRQVAPVDGGVRLLALDANGDVLAWARINPTGVPGDPQIEGLWRFAVNAAPGSTPMEVPLRWPAEAALAGIAPMGLCVDDDGALYLSNGHAVLRRAPDGQLSSWAGDVLQPGSADGAAVAARFNEPRGLVCEGRGVYVADSANHTVRHVDAQRRVRTVLGRAGESGVPNGSVPGLLDAPASLARVPGGIAVTTGLGVVIARY